MRYKRASYGVRGGRAMATRYHNRSEAGRLLATKLTAYADRPDTLVLALPRGGVPVGYEVAMALHAPLDVFLVRKLGVPGNEELAMGAIASGGVCVLNEGVVRTLNIPDKVIEAVARREQQELERRERLYRDNRPPLDVSNRIVILVDDGLATGLLCVPPPAHCSSRTLLAWWWPSLSPRRRSATSSVT